MSWAAWAGGQLGNGRQQWAGKSCRGAGAGGIPALLLAPTKPAWLIMACAVPHQRVQGSYTRTLVSVLVTNIDGDGQASLPSPSGHLQCFILRWMSCRPWAMAFLFFFVHAAEHTSMPQLCAPPTLVHGFIPAYRLPSPSCRSSQRCGECATCLNRHWKKACLTRRQEMVADAPGITPNPEAPPPPGPNPTRRFDPLKLFSP